MILEKEESKTTKSCDDFLSDTELGQSKQARIQEFEDSTEHVSSSSWLVECRFQRNAHLSTIFWEKSLSNSAFSSRLQ